MRTHRRGRRDSSRREEKEPTQPLSRAAAHARASSVAAGCCVMQCACRGQHKMQGVASSSEGNHACRA